MSNVINTYVNAGNNPTINKFNPSEQGVPTEAQLGINQSEGLNNHNPNTADPTNYFIFDAGEWDPIDRPSTTQLPTATRWWMIHNPTTLDGRLYNGEFRASATYQQADHNPGGIFNEFKNEGFKLNSYAFKKDNGPRGLGYMRVLNQGWLRINNEVASDYNAQGIAVGALKNEAWLQGSLEMTLRPQKENCSIVSGVNFPRPIESIGSLTPPNPGGASIGLYQIPTGLEPVEVAGIFDNLVTVETTVENGVGPGEEYAQPGAFGFFGNSDTGFKQTALIEYGLSLTTTKNTSKYINVALVNGIVTLQYKIFYGDNAKDITISGKTNIVDGKWHHVVINRPTQHTFKTPGVRYGGKGCIEIWVDGKLEVRSYEITSDDIFPTPQILFNDAINPGVLNYRTTFKPDWVDEYVMQKQYIGDIREFVLRQTFALTPGDINKNYAYAILGSSDGNRIVKTDNFSITCEMKSPTVSVNKKTVLKLYWNNLLTDKEKMLNGLEFDETYNVRSYSVTHKNLINDTQTFNLDLTNQTGERKYLTNVKTAINQFVYTYAPTMIPFSTSGIGDPEVFTPGFAGRKQLIDLSSNPTIGVENYEGGWHVSNLLFGGVYLEQGDRILLTNQYNPNENGIWIYNAGNLPLLRDQSVDANDLTNAHVYVEKGKYAGKTFVQTLKVNNVRKSSQKWREVDNNASLSTLETFPIHTKPYSDSNGNQRFIDITSDINFNYDIIAFMNYPTEGKQILESLQTENDVETFTRYKEFLQKIKNAVSGGKRLFVSSPLLAVDLDLVDKYYEIPQLLESTGDAQSASISPFESAEAASNYFDTHRNMKYYVATPLNGLTNRQTYIMSDFVTYSPNGVDSDYHIKYNYRQNGLLEGDEFYIPGLTTLPETLNGQLPGYLSNQKTTKPLIAFAQADLNFGTAITKFSNSIYSGSTAITNPYNDYITTIAGAYGSGKIFINCVENGYAFSRSDYNVGRIQNVTIGQNSETALTAAWQYSTKRLNKQNLYDFSDTANLIGQTTPTNAGGGPIVQSQSHCSNGIIRKNTNKNDLKFQSDLYPDFTEEIFETTEIPVLSMTWLGLKWLAE